VVLDIDGNDDRDDQLPQDLVAPADADAGPGIQVVVHRAEGADKGQNE
jgi:hypothetical protein